MARLWLPEPAAGTPVCGGFDGSDSSDWTALSAETRDGFSFTPRYGPDRRPTIWRPEEWGGRIPRDQVDMAIREFVDRYAVSRVYYDPPRWETDGERWALEHGEEVFLPWETYRTKAMHAALERFYSDLSEGRITQDGCPLTELAMANARKIGAGTDRYKLAKPSPNQKIDPAVTRVLAHEAAMDTHADGWPVGPQGPAYIRLPR